MSAITHEQKLRINGSGLFFFMSDTPDTLKLSIMGWMDSLNDLQKVYLEILIQEGKDDAIFDSKDL